GYITPLD
nr:Chain A, PawL-Derived Peptide PLP-46 [Parthenium argentatum]